MVRRNNPHQRGRALQPVHGELSIMQKPRCLPGTRRHVPIRHSRPRTERVANRPRPLLRHLPALHSRMQVPTSHRNAGRRSRLNTATLES